MKQMYEHVNERNGKWSPLLSDDVHEIIQANAERFECNKLEVSCFDDGWGRA